MQNYDEKEFVNVGVGEDITIAELAKLVAGIVEYPGAITFDPSKPDGTPRKVLDVTRLHGLGWRHSIDLEAGIRATYQWFLSSSTQAQVVVA
jgi:GDP-L-fucose synthase